LPEDERKKFEKEFDDYRQKLDQAKEESVMLSVIYLSVYQLNF